MKTWVFLFVAILAFLLAAVLAVAEVTWYFNWYCSGCARIGARTTGTEGPFGSQGACESARSSMQSNMDRRGGGVRAESCYRTGFESPPPSPANVERSPQRQPGYSSPSYPQPQIDTGEQQRLEEERRRQQEQAERARQAEIERQKQEEFRRDRDDAARRLRGGGDATLGIRGNPTGDLQIRPLPEQSRRQESGQNIPPVWRQLHCAHNILKGVLTNAKEGDLVEMHYLAQEMKNALDSRPLGVDCGEVKPPPAPYGQKELPSSKMLIFYKKLLDATVREGEKVHAANGDLEQAKQKEKEAREQLDKARRPDAKREDKPSPQDKTQEKPPEKPEQKPKDDPIARAYEQQKAYQEKERRKIEEVYKQQKEKQAPLEDFSINLRAAQRQLNESNSRKTEATNQLNRYSQMSDQALANPGRAGELEQALTQRRN